MNKPEITDEEISGMMDFQQVLDDHRKAVSSRSARYWTGGITAAIITSLLVYYFTRNTVVPEPVEPNVSPLSQPEIPKLQKDSSEKKAVTITPSIGKPLSSKVNEPIRQQAEQQTEMVKADVYLPAEPVEGYPHLYKYFNDQLTYPKEAAKDSIQGVVSVTFIVRPTGQVDHITITHSLGPLFDAEALRVIEGMPVWKPAMLNGKPVPSKMSVPLTFRIETTKK
ncbi:MAG: TonB family protein [Bacteroidetes bacterium]|nr:TonB family protein [Bacteroidota bacterium]